MSQPPESKNQITSRIVWVVVFVCLLAGIRIYAGRLKEAKGEDRSPGHSRTIAPAAEKEDFAAARKGFVTGLITRGPAPQEYQKATPPAGVEEVAFPSGSLSLKGWISRNSAAGARMPAVVFLHGGFSHSLEDWESAAPFAQAGFVLFMPKLRGENGGEGIHESFLGEVDDALAAGAFLAANPNVDPSRVFLAGHSVGAVLTTLTSLLPSPFRAAAAFDGYLDMKSWAQGQRPGTVPYNINSTRELQVRNPMDFAHSLRCPIRLYVATDGGSLPAASAFASTAKGEGRDCEVVMVQGNHWKMVEPAVGMAAAWFQSFAAK